MRRAVLVILAAVAVFAAVVLVTGGVSDDSKSSAELAEEAQRVWIGAQACMPAGERRRVRRIQDQSEVRYAQLVDGLPNAADEEVLSTVQADPLYGRLVGQMEKILDPYQPGGVRYDQGCYDDAWERFKRRVARRE